jgi:hypothetical protein
MPVYGCRYGLAAFQHSFAPKRRNIRHAQALARLLFGQRRGGVGANPKCRRKRLKIRASASSKLHWLRQVIDSEMEGAGPLRT